MRLSELILLGSTVVKPKAGSLVSDQSAKEGCALGMAAVAAGCTFGDSGSGDGTRVANIAQVFGSWLLDPAKRPCSCWYQPREMPVQDIIAHLFDIHVMGWRNDWTLDSLTEWLRTVEPELWSDISPVYQTGASSQGSFTVTK